MPSFQLVSVRAPYEADIVVGRNRRRMLVDETFEIPIPSLCERDTRRVAVLAMPHVSGAGFRELNFIDFEGRLFRPYMSWEDDELWNSDRCRSDPPKMSFSKQWGDDSNRTTILGSPFRPSRVDVPEAHRRQARRRAPDALEEPRQRAIRIAQAGLVFMDGVLFQETRTPGWTLHISRPQPILPILPDLTEAHGLTLVDPRHHIDTVLDVLRRRHSDPRPNARIEVFEPDLLPRTTEGDAFGCFALHIRNQYILWRYGEVGQAIEKEIRDAIDTIETGLLNGDQLKPCCDTVERMASHKAFDLRVEDVGNGPMPYMGGPKPMAQFFLELRRALPPHADEPSSVDETDAEAIASAFN